eukprot:CAMPEP_0203765470 /NCGR_PEP_ID=MMETSP0098-20131031/18430_1 /ASSEMBLY_ACC=CAM_ASM_000208 /TAXON_ID=96639 /ORGANISM=" , Strain NY0313808BC1" /LENGTH=3391 /DNA_ID=CAMNT_0050661727 /DNA_START=232 /DNA_END=10404 /DNA_ORIENTATION=-
MYSTIYDRFNFGGKSGDTLQKSLEGLLSKDNTERTYCARKIRSYLEQEARGRSQESFGKVLNIIGERIAFWANGSDANASLACTVLIGEIMAIRHEEINNKTVQFANQLSVIIGQHATGRLPSNETNLSLKTLDSGTHVLGRLASGPTTATSVFVEFEMKRVLGWLRERNPPEMRRYAAVLILKELARNSPTLFNIYLEPFFECIYNLICDPKDRIRTTAAIALRHGLRVISQRDTRQKNRFYSDIYNRAKSEFPPIPEDLARLETFGEWSTDAGNTTVGNGGSFTSSASGATGADDESVHTAQTRSTRPPVDEATSSLNIDNASIGFIYKNGAHLHGALLALYELVGECTGEFVQNHFHEIFQGCVWRREIRFHSDSFVREALIMILPRLALHCPSVGAFDLFNRKVLQYLMAAANPAYYSNTASSSPSQRPFSRTAGTAARNSSRRAAFRAITQLGSLNKSQELFRTHIVGLFELVKGGMTPTSKWVFCPEALDCMRMLLLTHEVIGPIGTDSLVNMIPIMFVGGLNESLIRTLSVLSRSIPENISAIQNRLLQEVTSILAVSAIRGGKKNRLFQQQEQEKQFKQTVKMVMQEKMDVEGTISKRSSKASKRNSQGDKQSSRRILSHRSRGGSNSKSESLSSVKEVWRDLKGKATNWISGANQQPSINLGKHAEKYEYSETDPDIATQVLALRTLANFNFRGINLYPLLVAIVVRHLDAPHIRVRVEASRACCTVMYRQLNTSTNKEIDEDMEPVHFILEQLVIVALTDEDGSLRRLIVEELSCHFTGVLLKNFETVRSFLVLTNDLNFEVRAVAIEALGRFAMKSASYVMPSINKVLVRLLNELNFAVDTMHREESVVLLGLLVRSIGPTIARAHVAPITNTLLPKIHYVHKGVATAMLATLGEVARVGDEATLTPLFGKLLPIIADIIDGDSSSTPLKQEVALATLATLASNAGMPVWPYFCFHKLLDNILRIMVLANSAQTLRKQAMVTFGTLGALDPWLYRNQQTLALTMESEMFQPNLSNDSDRDLRNTVMLAYAAGVDSDDERDSGYSDSDSDSSSVATSEDEEYLTGESFGQDSLQDLLSELPPPLLLPETTQKKETLWGVDQRRTSYLSKADIYPDANSSAKDEASEMQGRFPKPQLLGPTVLPVPIRTTAVPPPSPKKRVRSSAGSNTKRSSRSSHSSLAHKRASTFQTSSTAKQSLSFPGKDNTRRSSARIFARKRASSGWRKSSIRDLAQQINIISQNMKQNRRRTSSILPGGEKQFSKNANDGAESSTRDRTGSKTEYTRQRSIGGAIAPASASKKRPERDADKGKRKILSAMANKGFSGAAEIAAEAAIAQVEKQQMMDNVNTDVYLFSSPGSFLPSMVGDAEEYYPRVAVLALSRVLGDPGLSQKHKTAIEVTLKIFRSLGKFCFPFLPIVMPHLIHVIQTMVTQGKNLSREVKVTQFRELGKLVDIVKRDIQPYVPSLFELVHELWHTTLKRETLRLVNKIASTLRADDLRPHIPRLLGDLLALLHEERDNLRFAESVLTLDVIGNLGASLEEHLFLVIPAITTLIDSVLISVATRSVAIRTLNQIVRTCNVAEYATLIMHPIIHVLSDCAKFSFNSQEAPDPTIAAWIAAEKADASAASSTAHKKPGEGTTPVAINVHSTNEMRARQRKRSESREDPKHNVLNEQGMLRGVVNVLTSLVYRLDGEYSAYIPIVEGPLRDAEEIAVAESMNGKWPNSEEDLASIKTYFDLTRKIIRGQVIGRPKWYDPTSEEGSVFLVDEDRDQKTSAKSAANSLSNPSQLNQMNIGQLKTAWDTAQISTEDEWLEWMRRFSLALLRESPQPSLQSCFSVAQVCEPLARELFNVAFLSCWVALDRIPRDYLMTQLEHALKAPKIPNDLLQVLLNLAEFMEHANNFLPIDIRILSDVALKCRANAKALRYKEMEFRTVPDECIESLITINNNLEQHQAAAGVVLYARTHFSHSKEVQPQWYERLGKWEDALRAYELQSQQLGLEHKELTQLTQHQLEVNVGRLRCLNKAGAWHTVLKTLESKWGELVDHDLEIGKRCGQKRGHNKREVSLSVNSAPDIVTRSEASDLFEELGGGAPQDTSPSPIGALVKNRSHLSSFDSHVGDEDARSLPRLSFDNGSPVRRDPRLSAVSSRHSTEDTKQTELGNIFGETSISTAEDRIFPVNALQRGRSPSKPNKSCTLGNIDGVIDVVTSELDDYFGGFGEHSNAVQKQLVDDRKGNQRKAEVTGHRKEVKSTQQGNVTGKDTDIRWYAQELATIGAFASYALGKWDEMTRYSSFLNEKRIDGCFLKIILSLHEEKLDSAQKYIDKAYEILNKKLSSLVVESYNRAYPRLLEVQHMVELQEILDYRRLLEKDNHHEAKRYLVRLRRTWSTRLQGVHNSAPVLLLILAYRGLVIDPIDDHDTWLNFAKVARKENLHSLSLQALMRLGIGAETKSSNFFNFGSKEVDSIAALHETGPLEQFRHFTSEDMAFHWISPSDRVKEQMRRKNNRVQPSVAFAYIKYIWSVGHRTEAISRLKRLRTVLMRILNQRDDGSVPGSVPGDSSVPEDATTDECTEPEDDEEHAYFTVDFHALDIKPSKVRQLRKLAVQVHCKLGSWLLMIQDEQSASFTKLQLSRSSTVYINEETTTPESEEVDEQGEKKQFEENRQNTFQKVLACYKNATDIDSSCYKAWHAWALTNFRASEAAKHMKEQSGNDVVELDPCVVPAIEGFFRSISLGRRGGVDVLQDILRLLTLWFTHSEDKEVERAVRDGFTRLEIDAWLGVIPQLIARLNKQGDLVCELLMRIGSAHPQILIYPLTVATKSDDEARSEAACYVMRYMRDSFHDLVDEAWLVSRELIRVAVLWHEKWYNRLEEASNRYFSPNRNVEQMINLLKPLHQEMDEGAETLHEIAFVQAFGLDLQEASEWLYKYVTTGSTEQAYLDQAWNLYYQVHTRIRVQLQGKRLELRHVSPHLLDSRDLQLAVPGTYEIGSPVIRISGFSPSVRIIPSKQRPRVITMQGSDGCPHMFLLKGNEDLRMDERVMQLFGLVNALLYLDSDTSKLGLEIQRYAVVPLSSSIGVVEWVPNCDTLLQLVKEYRETRNIVVNVEIQLMQELTQRYDSLTIMQKVEILEHALSQTSGQDLAKVLWLKSPNSEVWLDRRTAYTRSLAVMSMVGYILGLGDRHPSNLMLERSSGRILHIDFGDCFEVAMNREKFPEKVPFRLTRMLIKAMEASGIDGNFRHTCHSVMQVLRENDESILTMLEAFVYDPLISWRLLQQNTSPVPSEMDDDKPSIPEPIQAPPSEDTTHEVPVHLVASSSNDSAHDETLNKRAVQVIDRVRAKLKGKDFENLDNIDAPLPVTDQVAKLIKQATSIENLAQLYRGWSA